MRLHVLAAAGLLATSVAAYADTFEYKYATGPTVASEPVGFDVYTDGPAVFNTILPAVECHYVPYGNCDGIYIDHKSFADPFNPGMTYTSDTIAYVFGGGLDYEGALSFLTDQDFTVGTHPVPYSSGTLTVTQVAATPEPSSFALLGTGLFGVASMLRKRFA